MPAWPAGLACGHLADPALKSDNSRLFAAVNKAVSVLYNVTEDVDCCEGPRLGAPVHRPSLAPQPTATPPCVILASRQMTPDWLS